VTDPEELRTRAASIFERLRTSGSTQEEPTTDPNSDSVEDEPEVELSPSMAAVIADSKLPATDDDLPVGPPPPSPIVAADDVPAEAEAETETAEPFVLPGAEALGPLSAPASPRSPFNLPQTDSDDDEDPAVPIPSASPPRALPRILAIANQKGGVGKTTTAVNLGAALAELGYRVLVVDLDPQGNATTGLGINARNLDASVYDVLLHDIPIVDCIEPSSLRNLFVVPATIDLAGAEIELVPVFSRELRLKRALQSLGDDFDFTLIDCPPSLGLLTVNGLAAAGEVVVPIQCEYYALEGLGQLLRNVNLVQSNLNPGLEVSTIILTMYDARTRLAEQVVKEVRKHFGDRVCRSVVPRTVRLSEAPSFGQPIIVFDSSSRGAIAYRELAKEVSGGSPQRVG
jgi:chromosome partitioning protein